MLEDIGLFDPRFTVREMLSAFVKVNIDDDIYYQDEVSSTPQHYRAPLCLLP